MMNTSVRLFASACSFLVLSFSSISQVSAQVQPPVKLAPFSLRWMNAPEGTQLYNSADHPNAVYVFEGFFRACTYCNQNVTNVERLQQRYSQNKNVQILDLGRDCRDSDYYAWINTYHPNHPVVNDCEYKLLRPLGAAIFPTAWVLDCNRNVIAKFEGGPWTADTYNRIVATVDQQLAKQCVPESSISEDE